MTTTSMDMHVPTSGARETLEVRAEAVGPGSTTDRPETELRAAARRRGLTMKELADKMGVSAGYLSQIANGRRPWTPKMREKAASVLGVCPRIRSWRRKPPRNNLLTVIWTSSWSN